MKQKREYSVIVRLNATERHSMKAKVASSGLKQEVFIRKAIAGTEIRQRPQRECIEILSEVRRMSRAVNQIAAIAHEENTVSSQDILYMVNQFKELIVAAKALV